MQDLVSRLSCGCSRTLKRQLNTDICTQQFKNNFIILTKTREQQKNLMKNKTFSVMSRLSLRIKVWMKYNHRIHTNIVYTIDKFY